MTLKVLELSKAHTPHARAALYLKLVMMNATYAIARSAAANVHWKPLP